MIQDTTQTLRVLFIDDSQDDAILIAEMLKKEYSILWKRVESESGLVKELAERWDVILCDYRLPLFSAERALEIVREMGREQPTGELPFIVISGVVNEEIAVHLLKKGAHDFISKDRMQRLVLAIRREIRHVNERIRTKLHIEDSYDATIEAWGKALELRDAATKGHTERVTVLALRMAVKLNLSHKQFVNINRGSLLHDIGKMGIPDIILLKPDILNQEEMNIMKMHPILAYNMLRNIPFLHDAVDIPFCHHERWNGTGYPRGLMGTEIPLTARLFAVVDVYDALTSERPYRPSWDKARAIDYLLGERNITLEGGMVDIFVDMVGRG